jgi:hypothetical protein
VAVGLISAFAVSNADAQSTNDAEIAALNQQLRLIEQKRDKLRRQTIANTAAAANAKAVWRLGWLSKRFSGLDTPPSLSANDSPTCHESRTQLDI